jgi:hypothetical protein
MSDPRPESLNGALLTMLPPCTQCGHRFYRPACGPNHAVIAANPLRHRRFTDLLSPLLAEAEARTGSPMTGVSEC